MASPRVARTLLNRLAFQIDTTSDLPVIRYTRTGNIKAVLIKESRRILGEELPDLTDRDWTTIAREGSNSTVFFIRKNVGIYEFLRPLTPGHIRFFSRVRPLNTKRSLGPLNTFLRKRLTSDFARAFRRRVQSQDEVRNRELSLNLATRITSQLELFDAFTVVKPPSKPIRGYYSSAELSLERYNALRTAARIEAGRSEIVATAKTITGLTRIVTRRDINKIARRLDNDRLFIQNLTAWTQLAPATEQALTDIMQDFLRQNVAIVNDTTIAATVGALRKLRGQSASIIGASVLSPGRLGNRQEAREDNRLVGTLSLTAIKNRINQQLYSRLKRKMVARETNPDNPKFTRKTGRLVYRTGRFARTSRVTHITPNPRGRNVVHYRYKRPYGIFDSSSTSPLATPMREPRRNLLRPAIESILSEIYGSNQARKEFLVSEQTGREGGV